MDILYRLGEATVEQLRTELMPPPHYSTARALLRVLEKKGHISHTEQNLRYVYGPIMPKQEAAQLALDRVLTTFFNGSIENLLKDLLSTTSPKQTRQILDAMRKR